MVELLRIQRRENRNYSGIKTEIIPNSTGQRETAERT